MVNDAQIVAVYSCFTKFIHGQYKQQKKNHQPTPIVELPKKKASLSKQYYLQ